MIAYCVCNIVTDKRYIGVTTTPLPKRWTPERRAAQARRMAAVSAHVHQTFPRDENGRFFRPEEAA